MTRVFNFSPGPAALPEAVLQRASEELVEWRATGMSPMELSHRGKDFISIAEKAVADFRELLKIPEDYEVLFLAGGASGQFAAVPMNLWGDKTRVSYVSTGYWSEKAIAEARLFGHVHIVASGRDKNFTVIPPTTEWRVDPGAAYLHYTANETIGGVEYHGAPEIGDIPVVADMSSNILSRPVDVAKHAVIYGSAQKNLGLAGLSFVIVGKDQIKPPLPGTPSILDYSQQAKERSMVNTPPTYAIYIAGLMLEWLRDQGGVEAIEARNIRKAERLYSAIDASSFYSNPVRSEDRSRMNAPFHLADPALEKTFLDEAKAAGLASLEGHRSVGGVRASIYNAMPEEGVDTLVSFMHDFERRWG